MWHSPTYPFWIIIILGYSTWEDNFKQLNPKIIIMQTFEKAGSTRAWYNVNLQCHWWQQICQIDNSVITDGMSMFDNGVV